MLFESPNAKLYPAFNIPPPVRLRWLNCVPEVEVVVNIGENTRSYSKYKHCFRLERYKRPLPAPGFEPATINLHAISDDLKVTGLQMVHSSRVFGSAGFV